MERAAREQARTSMSAEDRFWAKVAKTDKNSCWLWTGARKKAGYGNWSPKRGMIDGAHRWAFIYGTGSQIPTGFYVCHSCDNPACCNPNHLWLGRPADNVADMWAKGRAVLPKLLTGESHPKTTLTNENIAEIRNSNASSAALARQYGVHRNTIWHIRTGRRWAGI